MNLISKYFSTFLIFTQFVNYAIISLRMGLPLGFFYKKIHHGTLIKH